MIERTPELFAKLHLLLEQPVHGLGQRAAPERRHALDPAVQVRLKLDRARHAGMRTESKRAHSCPSANQGSAVGAAAGVSLAAGSSAERTSCRRHVTGG